MGQNKFNRLQVVHLECPRERNPCLIHFCRGPFSNFQPSFNATSLDPFSARKIIGNWKSCRRKRAGNSDFRRPFCMRISPIPGNILRELQSALYAFLHDTKLRSVCIKSDEKKLVKSILNMPFKKRTNLPASVPRVRE